MKPDIDIRTYFMERSPGSRKIVDFLLRNSVNTMEELCTKGSDWLMTALDMGEENSNEDIFNTTLSVIWKYSCSFAVCKGRLSARAIVNNG